MNDPSENGPVGSPKTGGWRAFFPAVQWLSSYPRGWLRADLVAGVTLAAYLLPGGLGDASLAGLPPQAGLYACLFSGLVYWVFCSSRHTAITVTSAISLLIGSTLGGLSRGDPARFGMLAAGTALLVAALALIAWAVRAGVIVNFISETVLIGFKSGVALYLASTQLPKLCGLHGVHGNFWQRTGDFLSHLSDVQPLSLALGATALAVLGFGKRFLANKPVSLLVVIGGIAAAGILNLGDHGVQLLGPLPEGLPDPGWPALQWSDLQRLLPLAFACFLLGAVETAAVGRMFGEKHGYRLDSNQEFLALAGANLAAGLGQGFPVSGGTSQSLVNESTGARTPLSGLIAAGVLLVVTVSFSGSLRNLPQPVLAAIVIFVVTNLFNLAELRRLWRFHRGEFIVAIGALFGVLGAGLLDGVLIGAIISLVLVLRRAAVPHVAFLGRIPGTRRFSDLQRHTDNEATPGILPFRVESGIFYVNTDHVFDTVLARVASLSEPLRLVVCDLSTSPYVDIAGARMFLNLHEELVRRGIALRLVEAHSSVRDLLRREGVEEKVGRIDRFNSLADMIDTPDAHMPPTPEKLDNPIRR